MDFPNVQAITPQTGLTFSLSAAALQQGYTIQGQSIFFTNPLVPNATAVLVGTISATGVVTAVTGTTINIPVSGQVNGSTVNLGTVEYTPTVSNNTINLSEIGFTSASVNQPIYGTVSGQNQYLGAIQYTTALSGSNVTLQYSGFAGAQVNIAGSYVVNVGGRGYTVGYSYPESTSYNSSSGQVSFTPTVTFAGGNPLPSVPLFSSPQTVNQGGVPVAYNVLVSPFTTPQVQAAGFSVGGSVVPNVTVSQSGGATATYSVINGQVVTSASYASAGSLGTVLYNASGAPTSLALTNGGTVGVGSYFQSGGIKYYFGTTGITPISQILTITNPSTGLNTILNLVYSNATGSFLIGGGSNGGTTLNFTQNGVPYTATLTATGVNVNVNTASPLYGIYLANQAAIYGSQLGAAEKAFSAGTASPVQTTLLQQAGLLLAPYSETLPNAQGVILSNPTGKTVLTTSITATSPYQSLTGSLVSSVTSFSSAPILNYVAHAPEAFQTTAYGSLTQAQYNTEQGVNASDTAVLQAHFGTVGGYLIGAAGNVVAAIYTAAFNLPLLGGQFQSGTAQIQASRNIVYSNANLTTKGYAVLNIGTVSGESAWTGYAIGSGVGAVGNLAATALGFTAAAGGASEGALATVGKALVSATPAAIGFGALGGAYTLSQRAFGTQVSAVDVAVSFGENAGMVYGSTLAFVGLSYGASAVGTAVRGSITPSEFANTQPTSIIAQIKATFNGAAADQPFQEGVSYAGRAASTYGTTQSDLPFGQSTNIGYTINAGETGSSSSTVTTVGTSSVAAYLNAGGEQNINGLPSPLASSDTATVRGVKTNLADVGYTGVLSGTTARGNLININIIGETTMGATEGTPPYGITGGQTTVQYEAKGTVTTGIEAKFRNLLGIPYRTVSLGSGTLNVNAGASSPTSLSLVTAEQGTSSTFKLVFNGEQTDALSKTSSAFTKDAAQTLVDSYTSALNMRALLVQGTDTDVYGRYFQDPYSVIEINPETVSNAPEITVGGKPDVEMLSVVARHEVMHAFLDTTRIDFSNLPNNAEPAAIAEYNSAQVSEEVGVRNMQYFASQAAGKPLYYNEGTGEFIIGTPPTTEVTVINSRTVAYNGQYIDATQKGTPDFSVTSIGKTELGTSYSGKIYLSTGNTASLQFTEVSQFSNFDATPENAPSSAWAKLNSAFTQATTPPSSLPKIESFSLSQVAGIQPTGGTIDGVTGGASVAQLSMGETVAVGGGDATATTGNARVIVPTIPAERIFQQAAITAPAETTTGLQSFNAYDPAILTTVGATALSRGTAASTVATTGGGTAVAAIAEPTGTRTINAGVSTTKVGLGVSSQGVVFNSAIGINAPSSSRAVGASASAIGGNVGATKTQTTYRTINEGSFLALNTAGIAFNTEYPRILQGHPTRKKVIKKEQTGEVVKVNRYLNIDKILLYTEGVVTAKPQVKDALKFSELNKAATEYKNDLAYKNTYKNTNAYKNTYKNAEVNKTTTKNTEKTLRVQKQVQKQVQDTTQSIPSLPSGLDFNYNTFNFNFSPARGKPTRIRKGERKNPNYQYITDITAQTFHIKAPKGSKKFYEGFGAARPIL